VRVFISSVIGEYEEYRAAAREAVQLVGETPVMAEHDFGARPMSPREACLAGVRESDIYVGLFGCRYGYITDRGISATEEEFEEAQREGIPTLVFVEEGEKEPAQEEFLGRVKDYGEGYFIDSYESPAKLKDALVKALVKIQRQESSSGRDAEEAGALLEELSTQISRDAIQEPWMVVGICPFQENIEIVKRPELGTPEFKKTVLQEALVGPASVMDADLGYDESVGEETIRWTQPKGSMRQPAEAFVEMRIDGVIQVGKSLGPGRAQGRRAGQSMLWHFLIDENRVEETVNTALGFSHRIYQSFEQGSRISSVYAQVRLGGLANKMLGIPPKEGPSSISVPMHAISEPLVVPKQPIEVGRPGMANPSNAAEDMLELVRRQFKLADAYYSEG
jgi:hypothetical protein